MSEGDDLGFRQLRAVNVARAERWHAEHPWSGSDWMVAAMGELGEAGNYVKKLNRARDGIAGANDPGVSTLTLGLAEELADAVTYIDLIAAKYGIDLARHVAAKFNHVSEREGFPERLPELDAIPRPPEPKI